MVGKRLLSDARSAQASILEAMADGGGVGEGREFAALSVLVDMADQVGACVSKKDLKKDLKEVCVKKRSGRGLSVD